MDDQEINRTGGWATDIKQLARMSALCVALMLLTLWIVGAPRETMIFASTCILPCVLAGSAAGMLLKRAMGQRWRNSLRGLLGAVALISIVLYLIVSRLQN